jgi:hypothetical protein
LPDQCGDVFYIKQRLVFTMKPASAALHGLIRRFAVQGDGVAALELALLLPVLIFILLGAFEVPRALLIYEKVTRVSAEIGDLAARQDSMIASQLTDLFSAADEIMSPFSFKTYGTVVVSSLTQATGKDPVIAWQCSSDTTLLLSSKIGKKGDKPVLPSGLTVGAGDNVIVAEVFYKYSPIFSNYVFDGGKPFVSATYYDIAYFRPRDTATISLTGNCPNS